MEFSGISNLHAPIITIYKWEKLYMDICMVQNGRSRRWLYISQKRIMILPMIMLMEIHIEIQKRHHFYCQKLIHFRTGKYQPNRTGPTRWLYLHMIYIISKKVDIQSNICKENEIARLSILTNLAEQSYTINNLSILPATPETRTIKRTITKAATETAMHKKGLSTKKKQQQ